MHDTYQNNPAYKRSLTYSAFSHFSNMSDQLRDTFSQHVNTETFLYMTT